MFPAHQVEARAQALLAALPEAEVLMGLPGVGPRVGCRPSCPRAFGEGPRRRPLFTGALVAVRHDPEMGAFYHRLLSRGKRNE